MTSAFGTVGLVYGHNTSLGAGAKLLSIMVMYIGRLGPLTIAYCMVFYKRRDELAIQKAIFPLDNDRRCKNVQQI